MANRLAKETSPYLLQHQNNPVDWHPWSQEAIDLSRNKDKPILVSIGYSACHWCHVMEHESFENPEIAKLMNDNFVCIKVDREERPDLDHIYQNVAQALTHSGGWPLTVFLTPALRPFFGGTYFPPEDRHGRPGFPRVLRALSKAYRTDPISVAENARKLTEVIFSAEALPNAGEKEPTLETLGEIAKLIQSRCDWENGGLAGAPKFPNPMIFSFLWNYGQATGSESAKQAVLLALTKMAAGGIYDQLGGGFHRYSVDEFWSVPHFEKMLYDNGLLLKLYSEVLLSHDPTITSHHRELFIRVIKESVLYLLREMKAPEGGFFAAQDADSEGKEGKYFAWNKDDLLNEVGLSESEAQKVIEHFGITPEGNFEHGKTVLFLANGVTETPEMAALRCRILGVRNQRIAPQRDDKVIASWNGLAISGLAWAGAALREVGDIKSADLAKNAAELAFEFASTRLSKDQGRLFSTFQGGTGKLNAYLDDYAFLAMAALDVARFSGQVKFQDAALKQCSQWIKVILDKFKDPKNSGYFFTSDDHEELLQRPKTIYDQAIPSGTAITIGVMLALEEMDIDGKSVHYAKEASSQLRKLFPIVESAPYSCGELLSAALLQLKGPVVVSGPEASSAVMHPHVFQKPDRARAGNLVCRKKTCSLPIQSREELKREVAQALKA